MAHISISAPAFGITDSLRQFIFRPETQETKRKASPSFRKGPLWKPLLSSKTSSARINERLKTAISENDAEEAWWIWISNPQAAISSKSVSNDDDKSTHKN